jgi:hypothetical protein
LEEGLHVHQRDTTYVKALIVVIVEVYMQKNHGRKVELAQDAKIMIVEVYIVPAAQDSLLGRRPLSSKQREASQVQ